jgi:hypothetical protein
MEHQRRHHHTSTNPSGAYLVDGQRAPGGAALHQGCSLQVDPIPHGPVKCVQRRSDRSEMTLLQHLCQMRSRRVLLPYSSDTAKVQPVRRNFGRHFLLFVAKDYQAIAPRLDGSQLASKARREGTQLQKCSVWTTRASGSRQNSLPSLRPRDSARS